MDNMENMDFEAMRDKQADELMQLLDERRICLLYTSPSPRDRG